MDISQFRFPESWTKAPRRKIIIPVRICFTAGSSLVVNYDHPGLHPWPEESSVQTIIKLVGNDVAVPVVHYQNEHYITVDNQTPDEFFQHDYKLRRNFDAYREGMVESAIERESKPNYAPFSVWVKYPSDYVGTESSFDGQTEPDPNWVKEHKLIIQFCVETPSETGTKWQVTQQVVPEDRDIEHMTKWVVGKAEQLTKEGMRAVIAYRTGLERLGKNTIGFNILKFHLRDLQLLPAGTTYRTATVFIHKDPYTAAARK